MGRGKFFIILLVVAAIIVLFCIPEIVQLQKSSSAKKSSVTVSREGTSVREGGELGDIAGPSPLDELSGEIDHARLAPGGTKAAQSNGQGVAPSVDVKWEQFRRGKGREALEKSRIGALELARSLPVVYTGSRYALLNYSNGVAFVLGKGGDTLPYRDSQGYLLALNRSVDHAMYRDTVSQSFVQRWNGISVEHIISKIEGGAPQFPLFVPQVRVTAVTFKQRRDKYGNPMYPVRAKVRFSGTIVGDNIAKAEILSYDGASYLTKKLKVIKTDTEYNLFKTPNLDGERSWTVRVYDKFGQQREKTYYFYERAQTVPYFRRDAEFPFHMEDAQKSTFIPDNVDPRVDAFFSVSSSGGGDSDGFFGGGDFEEF